MYLQRAIDQQLLSWKDDPHRKPILIRGARQVGKSSAVRELSRRFDHYLEVNFEEQRRVHELFTGDLSPEILCENLSVLYKIPIIPGRTLVFFDEIQACTPALNSLRFFYEKMPDLHLITAGSLLEFALDKLSSFGVGRVRTMFMYPFSFDEFLIAQGEEKLLAMKQHASPGNPLADIFHQRLLRYLRRFLVLGGMPEVMAVYAETGDLFKCQGVLDDLINSLQSDFSKYKKRVPQSRLTEIFFSVVRQTGNKFVFSNAGEGSNHLQVKEALELLIMAGLVIPVTHTSANGIPLGAEQNPKKRKMLVLDTGIYQRILGLEIADILVGEMVNMVNNGPIAELFAGLELIKYGSCFQKQQLFYWQREKLNSQAEVDYIIQKNRDIFPIEVKSGVRGSMQSLFLFLKEKKQNKGIRCSLENYSEYDNILVCPLYAIHELVSH